MGGIDRKTYGIEAPETEVKHFMGSFDTNSTSAPDGITGQISTVTRSGVGTFEVLMKSWGVSLYGWDLEVEGAIGTKAHLVSETLGTDGKCIIELREGVGGVAATLSPAITCATKAEYVDAENMAVITDEYGNVFTFEADPAGNGATGIAVDISGSTTAADVATVLAPLIASNCPWLTVVDNLDGTIDLTHKRPGAAGNAVTITESVTDVTHVVVSPLAGGVDAAGVVADTNNETVWFNAKMRRSSVTSR